MLDEPTNHLDAEGVRWLVDFINKTPGEAIGETIGETIPKLRETQMEGLY